MGTKINLELTLIKRQPIPGREKRHLEKGETQAQLLGIFQVKSSLGAETVWGF